MRNKKLNKKFQSNLLHLIIPSFYLLLGVFFLFNPSQLIKELNPTADNYNLFILLLHQGQGVLFISIALLFFQIRKKSKRLFYSLNSTFLAIIIAVLAMTCYFYFFIRSNELILMAIINFLAILILIYDKINFQKKLKLK